ncbi:MAG: hypothetical protein RLZZ511_1938 [Cyanobacteriota bacterium]
MKYRCEWICEGMATSYSGLLELEADDEDDARKRTQRIIWAREFRDRHPSSIKIHTIEAA